MGDDAADFPCDRRAEGCLSSFVKTRGTIAVNQRWARPIVVALIFIGVSFILAMNLNLKGRNPAQPAHLPPVPAGVVRAPAGFREYPIGEEVEKNQMRIAAVYLPPIKMEGMDDPASSGFIHIEADIHATEGNRNGFANEEFVPYLLVHYTIVRQDAKPKPDGPIQGDMMPMVARDGMHYGATIDMPKPGRYKLTYAIEPPSKGGLGRHSDPASGVDPWWKAFEVSFDWDYPGPP
jgi:periplasmic iron binding protein